MSSLTLKLAAGFATVAAIAGTARADGCGIYHDVGFNNNTASHHIQSGGYERYYAVWIPDGYNDGGSNTNYPVIFDYHGYGQTPWDQYDNSQYYRFDAGQNYVVVYPQGYDGAWQGPSYADPNINDLQFTTDLLNHIESEYCIDSSRVYASGKSNGGGFVDTLACSDNGDSFAAFAMASAALYTDTSRGDCTKQRAILESHGDEDRTIPYTGGEGRGGDLPNINDWIQWWGDRDCGDGATPQYSYEKGYNTTSFSCNGWANVVFHYQIYHLGHCWPCSTGDNFDALSPDQAKLHCRQDRDLSFTPNVLNFFSKWDINSAP